MEIKNARKQQLSAVKKKEATHVLTVFIVYLI